MLEWNISLGHNLTLTLCNERKRASNMLNFYGNQEMSKDEL